VNLANWLAANPSGTYPYNCPSPALTTPPAIGSDPGYTTTIFDAAGQTISATDPLGDTTSYTYDPAGNRLTTTNPDGKTTTDCYYWEDTGAGCASGAPSAGGTGDSLYSETTPDTTADPSGETTTYTYYPGGAADTTTTPAGTTTDSYDGLGDLTGKTYSNTASGYSTSADVSYTYYPDGSRESMTDGTGTTTYGTDAMGDVTSQAFSAASSSGLSSNTVGYGYFSTGQLETVSYPSYGSFENPTVIYSYDQLGNMASETDWLGTEVTFSHGQRRLSCGPERHQLHDLYLRQGGREHSGDNRGDVLWIAGHSHPIVLRLGGIPQHRRRGDRGQRGLRWRVLEPALL
jgi:YD repeat-containing protein